MSHRDLVAFLIGDAYKDWIYCDIVPMDACHLLLGRPWEFYDKVIHDGFLNTYSFHFNKCHFVLKPSPQPKTEPPSGHILLLQKAPFETAMREVGLVFVVVTTPIQTPAILRVPSEFVELIDKFSDVFLMIYHLACHLFVTSNNKLIWSLMLLFLIVPITR